MKIWVVDEWHESSYAWIAGGHFSTKEKAEAYVAQRGAPVSESTITEVTLDSELTS